MCDYTCVMLDGQAEAPFRRGRLGIRNTCAVRSLRRQRVGGPSPLFLLLLAVTIGGAVLASLDAAATRTTGIVVLVLGGWAVSLCLHEFGHAYVAYRSGDWSVRAKGYLTLDIRRYTDPVLSFVLPLVFLLIGGIPLPGGAVWIDHSAIRSRPAESAVSFAGPAANLGIGVLLVLAVARVEMPVGLLVGLSCLAFIQILAFLLNILPVPGLDGFGVLEPYLPYNVQRIANQVRPWAPLALFAVLIAVPGLAAAFFALGRELFELIGGDPLAAAVGFNEFLFWR
jgi:Zn-dependent protease